MGEFASKGLAGTALGFGIGGTAVSLLGGGLGRLLGSATTQQPAATTAQTSADATAATAVTAAMLAALNLAGRTGGTCNEDHTVNRYEAQKDARIAELETEVKLRDANTYTDDKMLEMYKYIDGRMRTVEGQICEQAVWNATQTATVSCIGQQLAQLQSVFQNLTKVVIPNGSVCPGWGDVEVSIKSANSSAA